MRCMRVPMYSHTTGGRGQEGAVCVCVDLGNQKPDICPVGGRGGG